MNQWKKGMQMTILNFSIGAPFGFGHTDSRLLWWSKFTCGNYSK